MGCGASAKVSPTEKWADLMGTSSMRPGKHFDAPDWVAMPTNLHDHERHRDGSAPNWFKKVVEKKPKFFEHQVENKRQRDFVEDVEDVDVLKAAHGSATRAVLMLKTLKTQKKFLDVPPPRFGRSAVPPLPRHRAPTMDDSEMSEESTQRLA
eukprot:s13_g32.t1